MFKKIQFLLRTFGAFLGRINTFLLMTISFYFLLTPMALIRRLFVSRQREPEWQQRKPLDSKHYEQQY
jgi:hypothetical protein